jgi:hypothetical protein
VVGPRVAVETITLILGLGEPLVGGQLVYDVIKARLPRLST